MKSIVALLFGLVAAQSYSSVVTIHVFNFDYGTNPPVGSDPIIEVGDTVHWVWDASFHTVTSLGGQTENFSSGLLNTGATFDHTFNTSGSYGYFCDLHGFDQGNGTFGGMGGFVHVLKTLVPSSFNIFRGIQISGSVAEVATSNDQYLVVQKGITANPSEPAIQVDFVTTAQNLTPTRLALSVEDGVNAAGLAKRVLVFNNLTNQFEQIVQETAQQADKTSLYILTGDLTRFVSQSDGRVRVRMAYLPSGPVTVNAWQARFDRVVVLTD